MHSAVIMDFCSQAQIPDSYDKEVLCTSIKTFDLALTLARDLQLFLIEKDEEKAAENQQKVISTLQDAKLKMSTCATQKHATRKSVMQGAARKRANARQSTLHEFIQQQY